MPFLYKYMYTYYIIVNIIYLYSVYTYLYGMYILYGITIFIRREGASVYTFLFNAKNDNKI